MEGKSETKTYCINLVLVLKGAPGSGKSTFAASFQEYVEKNGGICLVEGTDKHQRSDKTLTLEKAIQKVGQNLIEFGSREHSMKVVIIDTCGDKWKKGNCTFFGVEFSDWKIMEFWPNYNPLKSKLDEYLGWSLFNVLSRVGETNSTLSPEICGETTCVNVHMAKSKNLFEKRKDFPQTLPKSKMLLSQYKTYAQTQPSIDNQVKACFQLCVQLFLS
jgi:hypothetical protein